MVAMEKLKTQIRHFEIKFILYWGIYLLIIIAELDPNIAAISLIWAITNTVIFIYFGFSYCSLWAMGHTLYKDEIKKAKQELERKIQ